MAKPYSTARTLQKRTERTRERVQAWQTQCPAGHPTIPAVRLELLKFLPGGPKREAKHSLHTPVGVTFLQGPQFRMGAAGAPRRMCCQVRCPSLRTRPEQGRAQLRDQEITTHARLSSHAMHRSQPSQGSSDHLEASVGLRLRSLPLEPGQDRTKPSKAMFVKKSVMTGKTFIQCQGERAECKTMAYVCMCFVGCSVLSICLFTVGKTSDQAQGLRHARQVLCL